MKPVPLTTYPRRLNGRNQLKKLRSAGRTPAVIYGGNQPAHMLEVSSRDLAALVAHSLAEFILVDLEIKEAENAQQRRLALIKEVQHHPLNGQILHVDFQEVTENQTVTVTVPLETIGEAFGVKQQGGALEHVLFHVKLQAVPRALPEVIYVDVTDLKLNETLTLGDVPIPEGVELLGDTSIPVATIKPPRVAEATATPAEAEAAAEEASPAPETEPESGGA